jgi:DNA-directed RNA polymerase specialized sigma24 family protein
MRGRDRVAAAGERADRAYYEGLTYREGAQALNIPEGTAKWRLRSGLRRIGEQLAAEGFEDGVNV